MYFRKLFYVYTIILLTLFGNSFHYQGKIYKLSGVYITMELSLHSCGLSGCWIVPNGPKLDLQTSPSEQSYQEQVGLMAILKS